jgi:hypothetical protein
MPHRRIINVEIPMGPKGKRGRPPISINKKLHNLMKQSLMNPEEDESPKIKEKTKPKKKPVDSDDEDLEVSNEVITLSKEEKAKDNSEVENQIAEFIKLQISEMKAINEKLIKEVAEYKELSQKEKDNYMKELKGFTDEQWKEIKSLMKKTKDEHEEDVVNTKINTANEIRYSLGGNII